MMAANRQMVDEKAVQRKSRVQMVLIFLLFLLPPVAAVIAWKYVGEHGVSATTNAGTLIAPARPLSFEGLQDRDGKVLGRNPSAGRWIYVLFAGADCDARCDRQLYLTRQTRIAVSKDIPRVERLLVFERQPAAALASRLAREHADLVWVVRSGAAAEGFERSFSGPGFAAAGAQFFLVDPLGNLMMHYDLGVSARGILKDLQKLLKVSQIG